MGFEEEEVAENQYRTKRLKQHSLKARSEPLFLNPNAKKASGYNLITGQILKELPELDLNYLTQLFNESSASHRNGKWLK